MEDTGRINKFLSPSARQIIFGTDANAGIDNELTHITQADRAHVIMLAEAGIIDVRHAVTLLNFIDAMRVERFAALRDMSPSRGLYLLYENYLVDRLGLAVAGNLQVGRSRNDLAATTTKLRIREPFVKLVRELLRLQCVLIKRSQRYNCTVMPAFTHYQAAQPITYGHYLSAVARALERDIAALLDGVLSDLEECPMGGGAVGGTSFPIVPSRTASLLGFGRPVRHSIDAVASRDFLLRLLAAEAIAGSTLSRFAADFLLWSTAEFDFISVPDSLVGSSSMMPQKRNLFVLEHIEGLAAKPLGAFVGAITASHAKPFSNTIAANTEGAAVVWEATSHLTSAVILARIMVGATKPNPRSMRSGAEEGFVVATEMANQLFRMNIPFRQAHFLVGRAVRDVLARDEPVLTSSVLRELQRAGYAIAPESVDLDAVVQATAFGRGPAIGSISDSIDETYAVWLRRRVELRNVARRWAMVDSGLGAASLGLAKSALVD